VTLSTSQARSQVELILKDNAIPELLSEIEISPAQVFLKLGETIKLHVNGGKKPYSFSTDAGYLNQTLTEDNTVDYTAPTNQGLYHVTVEDANQQKAKAIIHVRGNLMVSPIQTVALVNEQVLLSAGGGIQPYTWPDNSQGRTWQTSYQQVGTHTVVVTDAQGETGKAIITVINDNLGISPKIAYPHPGDTINFAITGGTEPYNVQIEAGTISNITGQQITYITPKQPGYYTLIVTDANGIQGMAKIFVSAQVWDSSKNEISKTGKISSGMSIDGVPQYSGYILTDTGANIEIKFVLDIPADGKTYNTYSMLNWKPKDLTTTKPMLLFVTSDPSQPYIIHDPNSMPPFPIYKKAQSGEKLVIDVYKGNFPLSGTFELFAAYVEEGNAKLKNLLLDHNFMINKEPFIIEFK
jgi:plastocyanin